MKRVLPALAVAVFALAAAVSVGRAWQRIALPMQLNFVEGFNAADAARLASGNGLYGNPEEQPWVATVYTPLYFAATAAVTATGLDALLGGRLVAAVSALAICLVVVFAGWNRSRAVALVAGLGFLSSPEVREWLSIARPDFAAVALSCLGVVVAERVPGRRGALAAAALVAMAVLTKQTQVAALLAVAAVAFVRDPRRGWRVGAFAVGLVVAGAVALQVSSGGHFLWHAVTANANPFSLDRAASLARRFAGPHLPEIVAVAALLAAGAARRRLTLPWLYAALSIPITVAVGKVGSDTNYFLEPLAATALLVALELPSGSSVLAGRWGRMEWTLVVILATAVAAIRGYDAARTRPPNDRTVAAYLAAAEHLKTVRGTIVSDDATLLRLAGRPVVFQPFVMTQAAEAGHWDEGPFLAALADGSVTMVIAQRETPELYASRYTPEMRRIIDERFRPVATLHSGFVFTFLARRSGEATPAR
jgi:hypothetical protein